MYKELMPDASDPEDSGRVGVSVVETQLRSGLLIVDSTLRKRRYVQVIR